MSLRYNVDSILYMNVIFKMVPWLVFSIKMAKYVLIWQITHPDHADGRSQHKMYDTEYQCICTEVSIPDMQVQLLKYQCNISFPCVYYELANRLPSYIILMKLQSSIISASCTECYALTNDWWHVHWFSTGSRYYRCRTTTAKHICHSW